MSASKVAAPPAKTASAPRTDVARRSSPAHRNANATGSEPEAFTENASARGTERGSSRGFGSIAVFPPDRTGAVRPSPPSGAQAKLAVGRLDDPLEREADRMADEAMRTRDADLTATAGSPFVSAGRPPGPPAPPAGGEAPDSVRTALAAPGRAVDPGARAFFEPRFRFDFSHVRVHADALAARSASAIGARAYAVGPHIAFAANQYAPSSPAGRRLIAHELAHVVQAAARSPAAETAIVRRAPGDPVMYVTGSQTFNPPAAGATMATIAAQVKAKQSQKPDPDLGPSVNVVGVTAGQPEEIYVWNVLLQRAQRQFWGTQIQVVTPIGPAPVKPPGSPAPVGQIIIKIDGKGNATAEVVNRGPVAAPAAFPDEGSAIAALKSDFGFASVDDGTAHWSLADLNKTHAALKRLPAPDRAALAGVALVRDATLTNSAGKPRSGEFRHQASATAGSAGTPSVASRSESLHIADLAFSDDAVSFVGGKGNAAVASFETILHEAGHAVETKALRDAEFATFEAQAASNNATLAFNAEQAATNTAVRAANSAHTAAIAKFRAYGAPEKRAAQTFVNAYQAALRAVNAFANNGAGSRFAALEAAAAAAIARRDAEKGKLPAGNPALTDFAAALTTQDAWFRAAQTRARVSIKLDAAKAELTAKKAAEATVSGAAGTSKRLANFVSLVNKNKIAPLTQYAKDNWPGHPEEFFAEAYSLWLSSPDYLSDNARPLKDWFDAGEHLK